jgi:hypothetical protein
LGIQGWRAGGRVPHARVPYPSGVVGHLAVRKPLNSQPLISHLTNSNGCGNLQIKVRLTVSPFRPFLLPQAHVSPSAPLPCSPSISALCSPCLRGKARLFISLPPLCRSQKSQPLYNQANPDSFSKTPGVGRAERIRGTRGAGHFQDASLVPASPFRINTCKSVSKQTTLSSFRITTYEKPREGGDVQMPSARLSSRTRSPGFGERCEGSAFGFCLAGSCPARSAQAGLSRSISRIFFSRRQPLISFSRAIASRTSPKSSKCTRRKIL